MVLTIKFELKLKVISQRVVGLEYQKLALNLIRLMVNRAERVAMAVRVVPVVLAVKAGALL
jgi:hypothetical protein